VVELQCKKGNVLKSVGRSLGFEINGQRLKFVWTKLNQNEVVASEGGEVYDSNRNGRYRIDSAEYIFPNSTNPARIESAAERNFIQCG
jgi:hypothetical protein